MAATYESTLKPTTYVASLPPSLLTTGLESTSLKSRTIRREARAKRRTKRRASTDIGSGEHLADLEPATISRPEPGITRSTQQGKRPITAESFLEPEDENRILIARRNRDIAAVLMAEQWLGLHLLTIVRASSSSDVSALANKVERPFADVSMALVKIAALGLLQIEDGLFLCTDRGREMLDRLEAGVGVTLEP